MEKVKKIINSISWVDADGAALVVRGQLDG